MIYFKHNHNSQLLLLCQGSSLTVFKTLKGIKMTLKICIMLMSSVTTRTNNTCAS